MRGRRATAVALVLLALATGCTSGDGADGDRTSGGGPTTSEPVVGPIPSRPLQGAAVAVVGDEVWIVGGVAGYDPYEANPVIIRRGADGTILGTIPLDLPDGTLLEAASPIATVGGRPHLIGFRCTYAPNAENGACGTGEPALHRVEDSGLVALDVPAGWGTGASQTPGSFGYPPRAVGTVGDRIVTAAAVGEGPIAGVTEQVEVALYDPATASVTPVPTVPGVVTGSSVCADGERTYSLVPAIDVDRQITGADVWVQDDLVGAPDAAPRRVATVTLDGPRGISSGGLRCADGFVVVTGSTDGGAFAIVDTGTGEVVGDVTGWDNWGARLRVPPGGDGSRLVASRTPSSGEPGPITHRLVTRAGVTDLPDGTAPEWVMGIFPALEVVEVAGRLLDISAWFAQPDVEQPARDLG